MPFFRLNINRRKRRRIDFEEAACIQIEEASIDGKFVKLFNSGSKVSNLQGLKTYGASSFLWREMAPVDDEFQLPSRNESAVCFLDVADRLLASS